MIALVDGKLREFRIPKPFRWLSTGNIQGLERWRRPPEH
jgi:hypothetical protein